MLTTENAICILCSCPVLWYNLLSCVESIVIVTCAINLSYVKCTVCVVYAVYVTLLLRPVYTLH